MARRASKSSTPTGLPPLPEGFRIQLKHAALLGPGKVDVLQGIAATGSLAETARLLGMSYQRVWTLVNELNRDFIEPLVDKQRGGSSGGGAALSATGEEVLTRYRAMEAAARQAVIPGLPELLALLRSPH
ncbi:MAG: winged helix-turn-helix domain-containing protein [Inhella sp.]